MTYSAGLPAVLVPGVGPAAPARGDSGRAPRLVAACIRTGWLPPTVFVLGLLVYGWGVGAVSPWRDEAATLAICRRQVADILALSRSIDLVHLAYYLLAHVALAIHDTVTSPRLISVVAMAAAAAMLVLVGRRLGDPATGALAGLLLVASPLASRWAQDARPFALVTAVAVGSTLLLLRCLDRGSGWWWYAATLVLVGVLNLLALMLVGVHAGYVLMTRPRHARISWLLAASGALLVVAPFVALAFGQRGQVSWITVPHVVDLADAFATAFGARFLLLPVAALAVVAFGLVVLSRGHLDRAAHATTVLSAGWAFGPPVLLWTVSLVRPLWDAHYVLFTLPGLSLWMAQVLRVLAGAGLTAVAGGRHVREASGRPGLRWGRQPRALAVAVVAAVLCLAGLPAQAAHRDPASGHDEDVHGVAVYLVEHAKQGDAVLYVPYEMRDIGSSYPHLVHDLADVALARTPVESATIHGVDVTADALPARLKGVHRVWLVRSTSSRIQEEVDKVKVDLPRLGYRNQGDTELVGFRVTLFEG